MRISLVLLVTLVLASSTLLPRIPRQVLITKYIKNVGPTNPAAFIDAGRARLRSWNILTAAQLTALDTTDRLFFYNKAGINISAGTETAPGSGIFIGNGWQYLPTELQSTERLDWVVSDTGYPLRTSVLRRNNWITANGGNTLIFTADGTFSGGQWQGLTYRAGQIIGSEYVVMVPNVTMSRWNRNYELHFCRNELEPAVAALNLYNQTDTIVTKSCVGVTDTHSRSTIIATNIYTNTSTTTRDVRKTQSWTWSW